MFVKYVPVFLAERSPFLLFLALMDERQATRSESVYTRQQLKYTLATWVCKAKSLNCHSFREEQIKIMSRLPILNLDRGFPCHYITTYITIHFPILCQFFISIFTMLIMYYLAVSITQWKLFYWLIITYRSKRYVSLKWVSRLIYCMLSKNDKTVSINWTCIMLY